ncbi:DUF4882 family protein [Acinetobacter baumannii]|nr:DUF4882 family protein [Acinetobacter baumannii]
MGRGVPLLTREVTSSNLSKSIPITDRNALQFNYPQSTTDICVMLFKI